MFHKILEKSFCDNNSESHKIGHSFSSVKMMFEVKTDESVLFDSDIKNEDVLLPYHLFLLLELKKSVKGLSAIVVNAEPTMKLEPSTLPVFFAEEHNLACSWNTKVLFKIHICVRGTIKGIRGNLQE